MKIRIQPIAVALLIPLLGCNGIAEPDNELQISASGIKPVQISGRQILLNDSPYVIKGICYHPVPKGCEVVNLGRLADDLKLMQEAGINTIRVYEPIDDEAVLDAIHGVGLKVIIGFGYNQNGIFDIRSGSYLDYVNAYKNHEAILMWELGNEYNYHPEWFEDDISNWYEALNQAAGLIRQNDGLRPVATSHGDLPDSQALNSCPNIDVWGMNVYRWDDPQAVFKQWEKVSSKPMYLSEAGADSYMSVARHGYRKGENQKAQADANRNILNSIFRNQDICSGVTMFSFADGWWKAGNPETQDPGGNVPNSGGVPYDAIANEEYWGILDVDRNKKLSFDVIKEAYRGASNNDLKPTLSSTSSIHPAN